MASADELLDRLETLLGEERLAIRQLDALQVEACAEEKERLFIELKQELVGRRELHGRVVRIMRCARQNCVLLAYARDCVRDAMGSVARHLNAGAALKGTHRSQHPGERISMRVSVMG